MINKAISHDTPVSVCLLLPVFLCLLAPIGCTPPASPTEDAAPNAGSQALPSSIQWPDRWEGVSLKADVAWLLDEELAARSHEYRAAVEEIFYRQAVFCDGRDKLARVQVRRGSSDDGETTLTLYSPGRDGYGDTLKEAMTLRDGAVVGLTFCVENNFDSCPCSSWLHPECLNDEFLKTIARIDTLEAIDLSSSHVTDAGLKTLSTLHNLRSVNLKHTAVTCDGLEPLGTLDQLETFKYSQADTRVRQPPRLCHLVARHPVLRDLYLESVELTSEAAAALSSCSHLEKLDLQQSTMEAGALGAFAGHDRIANLSLVVASDAAEPILLNGMPGLEDLYFTAKGANLEIEVTGLPALRQLSLVARRDAPEIAEGREPTTVDEEVGHAPRLSVDGLASLEQASFTVHDGQFAVAAETGEIRLGRLPSLATLYLFKLDGKLNARNELPALTQLASYEAADKASLYRALPRCPNLEELKTYGGTDPVKRSPRPVEADDVATVFELKHLKKLQMASVRGRPLAFESFLKLPRLKELTLRDCELSESFEAAGHPVLEMLHFQWTSPRYVTVRHMPMLSRFVVTNSDRLETAKLIDCPALEWCWCTSTPNLGKLDLREANAADVDMTINQKEEDVVLLPAPDKERGAEGAS